MYCKHCGSENLEFAKFCKICGTPLRQRSEVSQNSVYVPESQEKPKPSAPVPASQKEPAPAESKPLSAETPKPKHEEYKPPYSSYTPSHRSYSYSSHSRSLSIGTDKLFWAVPVLLLLSFIGMFIPWQKTDFSASPLTSAVSESKDYSFFKLFDKEIKEDEDEISDAVKGSEFESKWDKYVNGKKAMKFAGLIGFIAAGAAIILAFSDPKKMTIAAVVSAICFVIAIIGGSTSVSAMNDILDELSSYQTGSAKIELGSGVIVSLVCSAAASGIAVFNSKN